MVGRRFAESGFLVIYQGSDMRNVFLFFFFSGFVMYTAVMLSLHQARKKNNNERDLIFWARFAPRHSRE